MLVINDMLEDWSKKVVPRVMIENRARSRTISKTLIILNNLMCFTYVLKTLLSYIFDPIEERKFLAAVSFPFDGRQSPFYELIFIGQLILASTCLNVNCMIEGILAFSVILKL